MRALVRNLVNEIKYEELVRQTHEEYFEFWIAKSTRFDRRVVDAIKHQRWVSS